MINNIIKIQSAYRGYKKRKYINNFYKKLPSDIQKEVLYFIKRDFYIERRNKKLDFIVRKKINKYLMDFNGKLNIDIGIPFILLMYIYNYQKQIIHVFKLFAKYQCIIKDKSIFYDKLKNNLNKIKEILNFYKLQLFNAYTNHIYESVIRLYRIISKIIP